MKRRKFIALATGAMAWPFAARAQRPAKMHRVAIVTSAGSVKAMSETGGDPYYPFFFQELRRLGYVEGHNLAVERHSFEGRSDRYVELAQDVVSQKPYLIFTFSSVMVRAFQTATTSVPIVGFTGDPVALGLVSNLARPGGNVTGVSVDAGFESWDKAIEMLKELVPTGSTLAFLAPRALWEGPMFADNAHAMARRHGLSAIAALLDSPINDAEYRRVFAELARERPDMLWPSANPENWVHRALIVELAAKARLPAVYLDRQYVELGGLMAYMVDQYERWSHLTQQIDQILKGTNPGDIPYYQPTKFKVIINLKTAKALGLTIPPTLLARADEVIE